MPLASESLEMNREPRGMRKRILAASGLLGLFLVGFAGLYRDLAAQIQPDPQLAFTATLDKEIRDFLKHEVTAHVADITSLDPPPDRVVGALTTGEFSWARSCERWATIQRSPPQTRLTGATSHR